MASRFHYIGAVSETQCQIRVLLNEQNGDARSRNIRIHRITSFTISGARPSEGSSSIESGSAIMARPNASICCSPPESVPAGLLAPFRQPGNDGNTSSSSLADDCSPTNQIAAGSQIVLHG